MLGVPGLLGALRAGNVAAANALGSGLLQSPAFLAFLPGLCRHLLGEELKLPSVATWWCGQPAAEELCAGTSGRFDRAAGFSRRRPAGRKGSRSRGAESQRRIARADSISARSCLSRRNGWRLPPRRSWDGSQLVAAPGFHPRAYLVSDGRRLFGHAGRTGARRRRMGGAQISMQQGAVEQGHSGCWRTRRSSR